MDKPKKQVRNASDCEECKERDRIVEDVIKTVEENKVTQPKKQSLFDLFKSLNQLNNSEITIKIEIIWPKDMQDI